MRMVKFDCYGMDGPVFIDLDKIVAICGASEGTDIFLDGAEGPIGGIKASPDQVAAIIAGKRKRRSGSKGRSR